jgi:5'-methylthioadenosine phosphorylase
VIGILGGTGIGEALGELGFMEVREFETPFGRPSGPIHLAQLDDVPIAWLSRHGPGHALNPSQVPYRANIFALKKLGVTRILATGAVGSLRESVAPRELAILDQVIDRTFRRPMTFFDELAAHVELAAPFCPDLRGALIRAAPDARLNVHPRATYVCIEGPQFSTRAESDLYRGWNSDVVGMTAMPEARLAREAEICYAMIALVTDYDCWRPHAEGLERLELLKEILGNLEAAKRNALSLIRVAVRLLGAGTTNTSCSCRSALALGLWTDKSAISREIRSRLGPLVEKYLA